MEFVSFIGRDKENWGQIKALLNRLEYEKAIIVKDKEVSDFPTSPKVQVINADLGKPLTELKESIQESLRERLSGDFEVLLSLASGTGKEHMALVSALLSIPVGIRLVVYTQKGVEIIT